MKKLAIVISAAALLSPQVQADTLLGLYLGGQVWDSAGSGTFGDSATQNDFNLDSKQQGNYYIALEHPIPLIPNIKIAKTSLDTDGRTSFDYDMSFGGEDFQAGELVRTTFDMSYIDYTLYYELLDNDLITLDVGVSARDFSGDIIVATDEANANPRSGSENISYILPMLYGSAIIGLPLTGLAIFAEGSYVTYDSQTVYDYQVGVSYAVLDNIAIDVDLTFGYRAVKLELDDLDDLYADLDFNGAFLGATVHF